MIPSTITRPRRPSRAAGVPVLLALALAGCSPTARPSDPARGREALIATLDAWKGGERPDALARRSPPIHASDGDWASGLRLLNYRESGEGRLVGSDLNVPVALELKDARGRVVKKVAVFVITTEPQLLVSRQDD